MSKNVIPCKDNPDKVFILDVHKPQRGPAVATASEVEPEYENGRMTTFTYIPFQDRHLRVPLDGRNTKNNRALAMASLLREMEDKGWVERGHGLTVY